MKEIRDTKIQNRVRERAQFTGKAYGFLLLTEGEDVLFETDRTYVTTEEGENVRLHSVTSLASGRKLWNQDVTVKR